MLWILGTVTLSFLPNKHFATMSSCGSRWWQGVSAILWRGTVLRLDDMPVINCALSPENLLSSSCSILSRIGKSLLLCQKMTQLHTRPSFSASSKD